MICELNMKVGQKLDKKSWKVVSGVFEEDEPGTIQEVK